MRVSDCKPGMLVRYSNSPKYMKSGNPHTSCPALVLAVGKYVDIESMKCGQGNQLAKLSDGPNRVVVLRQKSYHSSSFVTIDQDTEWVITACPASRLMSTEEWDLRHFAWLEAIEEAQMWDRKRDSLIVEWGQVIMDVLVTAGLPREAIMDVNMHGPSGFRVYISPSRLEDSGLDMGKVTALEEEIREHNLNNPRYCNR